jgi:hypothetical protein
MSTTTLAGNGHAQADGIRWPFGQFKGQWLSEINSRYLRWVLRGEGWDDSLRADVADELRRRGRARRPPRLERTLDRWRLVPDRRAGHRPRPFLTPVSRG